MKNKKILVLCTGNSCRSQIAEGYLKLFLKSKVDVFSAGVNNHEINSLALKTMKDDGIDISNQTSNNIKEFNSVEFDHIITVCDNAQERCPIFFSKNAIKTHRAFFDPSSIKNPKLIDSAFEKCREEIKLFCKEFSEEYFS
tara:strand:- start:155 stop:577 length:423 start_codon:yes stop_codon:yes gene_type:complete